LCTAPYRTRRLVSQIYATRAFVAIGIPQQRSKFDGFLLKAISDADKQNDWQTHYIAGRAVMEPGRQDSKAKALFGRAISINSRCDCANYWLACLQSTSSDQSVKDPGAGTRLLESLWSGSDKKSWRLSFALVRAYDADKKADDAEQQWNATLTLAPAEEREKL